MLATMVESCHRDARQEGRRHGGWRQGGGTSAELGGRNARSAEGGGATLVVRSGAVLRKEEGHRMGSEGVKAGGD